MQELITLLHKELPQYSEKQLNAVMDLLNEGNTVPFIARYRKEATGTLDEVELRQISEESTRIENLEKRKEEVINSIENQDKMTEELRKDIRQADKLQRVEDLYLPYKQKRRTKATVARENGLAPLADFIRTFPESGIKEEAEKYITEDNDIETIQDALDGAHEIMAEEVGDNPAYRERTRQITKYVARLIAYSKDEDLDEQGVYEMYYDYSEPLKDVQGHRVLAINRGEAEGVLTAKIQLNDDQVVQYLIAKEVPKGLESEAADLVKQATEDGYKRFIKPSIERELRQSLTEDAENHAIDVFSENLKNLLLQAPLKGQTVMGFDPAFRSGSKLAVVDHTGKVLDIDIIYPHKPASRAQREAAGPQLIDIINEYDVDTIAIGNGTASRESEQFVADTIKEIDKEVNYVIVSEAGASVYSASDEARREFPDLTVEKRSAVSIARRLQDPLAELVKIDPKSLGIGQYQHDVSQTALADQLDFVIETAVNRVGVNLNTASSALLERIAGLNKTTANNIVKFREENNEFTNRKQIKDVSRIGAKTYEQAIGFLRITNGENPLDNTGIHPETYKEADAIINEAGIAVAEIGTDEAKIALGQLDKSKIREETGLGKETLKDIMEALITPGRDMRDEMPAPILKTEVLSIEDLRQGMQLDGTVRNVVDFGAFVDVGVKEDGLVHISKMSKKYIKNPSEMVSVGDIVTVWVEDIDLNRQRISLTMLPMD